MVSSIGDALLVVNLGMSLLRRKSCLAVVDRIEEVDSNSKPTRKRKTFQLNNSQGRSFIAGAKGQILRLDQLCDSHVRLQRSGEVSATFFLLPSCKVVFDSIEFMFINALYCHSHG